MAKASDQPKRNVLQRILRFFREVRAELRKVAWPNRKELTSYTIVVLVAVAIVAVYVGVIDYLVSVILGLVI